MCFNQNFPSTPHDVDVDMEDADFTTSFALDSVSNACLTRSSGETQTANLLFAALDERIRGVGFYVHSSIRTDQRRVWPYPGDNEDIFATLGLMNPSGPLSIHNVYNHNNRLDVPALLQHLASYESSKCDMVLLGDFNYHHGSWSIKDTGQQSPTIDLTYASRKLATSVLSCKALQVPRLISDHRVIETVIRRQVKTHVRMIPQWQEADHEAFQRSLEPLLPPLDAPLDTDDQRDKYMTDIMYGLMEAIHDNVPVRYLAKRHSLTSQHTEDPTSDQQTQPGVVGDVHATTKGAYELAGIANETTAFREGTKGFYIRIKDTDKLLFFTCRNVLFSNSFPNFDYHHNGNAPNMVIQPGQETYEHFVRQLLDCTTLLQDLGDKTTPAQREELDRAKEMKEKFEKLHEKKSRIIGHVLYSHKYSLGISETGAPRLRNWALVELNQDKHETVFSEMRNMVVASPRAGRELWRVLNDELDDEDRRRVEKQLPFHHINTYDLTRTVQEFEIKIPNEASRSLENQRAMVVAKFGRSTSLTFVVANEVKSVCRVPVLGQEFISEEWCILGHKKRGQCRRPFSEDGDSGSCILDMYGRVGGMLTGGKLAQGTIRIFPMLLRLNGY
ncbi:hypothetical protein FANTH_8008 [Fusarium anthophilum]|uniref:Endonuclease/exonuclease/phosphatase domain-containing protein n=1 Tax=Fusarium anthophilum TaxID=48485 RepID=A0A8H5E1I2_9HYPO|nr:hypothetical protein FANTH_8008 [Fusarium anthophilum]